MRNGSRRLVQLAGGEFEILRDGFGWPSLGTGAAEEARRVVLRWHPYDGMFVCDCRGRVEHRPALVLRRTGFLARHVTPAHPEHSEDCPFARDPTEGREIVRSYRHPAGQVLRLLGPLQAIGGERHEVARVAYATPRSAVAQLLMRAVVAANIQQVRWVPSRMWWEMWVA